MTSNTMPNSVPAPRMEVGGLRLEMLELLPCGCVVAVQRMAQSGVRIVSLEAKGPHCLFSEHRANRVIRLGELADVMEDYEDEEAIRVA
jgi:hypothetical protein